MKYLATICLTLTLNGACSSSREFLVELKPQTDRPSAVHLFETAGPRSLDPNDVVVCAWIADVHATYLCLFNDSLAMNLSLLRAGLFIQNKAGLVSNLAVLNSPLMSAVEGHDFTGSDLKNYYGEFRNAKPSAILPSSRKLRLYEDKFWGAALEPIFGDREFTLIACSLRAFRSCINHEILHAQFNSDSVLRALVSEFYEARVDSRLKAGIEKRLREYYDISDRNRLYTEFFAYISDPVDPSILRPFAEIYREPLQEFLRKGGKEAIIISRRATSHN